MSNNRGLLPHLRVFVLVAEKRSFTAAANELGASTAAVSRSIQRLESEIGWPLFRRTTRRVGLTPMGARLYEDCRESIRALQRAVQDVRAAESQPAGALRVSCAHTFGRRFVAPAVIDFRILYPEIQVELTLTDDLVDLVDGDCDVAIRGGRPRDARLISRALAPLPLYTCASPSLLQRYPAPRRVDELRHLPCIGFRFRSTRASLPWEFIEHGQRQTLQPSCDLWVDDMDVAYEAAIAGLGFAQLSGYVAVSAIRSGELIPVLPQSVDASRSFSIVYLNRRDVQPLRARLFIDHLLTCASDPGLFALSQAELLQYTAGANEEATRAGARHRR